MTSDNSIDQKHSTPQSCNKWQSYESTKRKHKPIKCYTDSERCRRLNLVKLCNYVLISCALLVCLINANESSYGCSSNPCIFGVCIDDLNRWVSYWLKTSRTGGKNQPNSMSFLRKNQFLVFSSVWIPAFLFFCNYWHRLEPEKLQPVINRWKPSAAIRIIAPFFDSIYRLIRFKNNFMVVSLTAQLSIPFQFVFLLLYRRLHWPAMSNKLGWVLVGSLLEWRNMHWWRRRLQLYLFRGI